MNIINTFRDSVKYYDKTETIIPRSFAVINHIAELDQYSANLDPIKDSKLFYFSKWENLGSNISKFNFTFPIVALQEIDIEYTYAFHKSKKRDCRIFDLFVIDFEGRRCPKNKYCEKRAKQEIYEDCILVLNNVINYVGECVVNTENELVHKSDPNRGTINEVESNLFRVNLNRDNEKSSGFKWLVADRIGVTMRFKFCLDICKDSNPTFEDKEKYNEQGCC